MSDEAAVREVWRPGAEPWEALSEADRRYDGTPEPMFSREFWEGIVGRLSGMGWRLVPKTHADLVESDDWRDGYNTGYGHGWDQCATQRVAELEAENKRLRELAGEAIEYVPSYFREKWGMDEELASVPVPEGGKTGAEIMAEGPDTWDEQDEAFVQALDEADGPAPSLDYPEQLTVRFCVVDGLISGIDDEGADCPDCGSETVGAVYRLVNPVEDGE